MSDLKKINTTPVFQRNLQAYQHGWPIICNEGGSRSGKTYSIIQLLCGIAQGTPGQRISIVSHSLPHIKRGAYRDFRVIMADCGWWHEDQFRYTDYIYTFPNGSYIELFGLEDEGKARGPGRDILFVNEANLIKKPLFDQLAMRTTGTIFLDWNPADFASWVYTVADDQKNKCIHSTYLDNIYNLSQNQIGVIEGYKNLPDPFMWQVYGEGKRGASAELIYTYYKQTTDVPDGDVAFGLDFGFNHPSALIKCTFNDGVCYAEEMVYQSNLTTPQLIDLLKQHVARHPVYCDSARPDLIEEIYKAGINAKKADKDVFAGILAVKKQDLRIHANSRNLLREMSGYKWETDRDGNIISPERPVKQNDDACDALRYAIFSHLVSPKITMWSIYD
jgi:phage terminase large subunit